MSQTLNKMSLIKFLLKNKTQFKYILKISLEEVIKATVQSNIHPRIDSLPDKYNTLVGSKGGQLSGGEKQRVAIGN